MVRVVRVYIVTYTRNDLLNRLLDALRTSDEVPETQVECYVINNHSDFELTEANQVYVTRVYHNTLRPDFSTGHLARNWNQAIINGFESLLAPKCDLVVTMQNDTLPKVDWLPMLLRLHQDYDFVQFGAGDEFCSYTVEAVRRIGLWDERFCGIGYQEADYFLRARLFCHRSIINDTYHRRVYQPVSMSCLHDVPTGYHRGESYYESATRHHAYCARLFKLKWGGVSPEWDQSEPPSDLVPSVPSFIYYPYFELDVYPWSMTTQRYIS